MKLSLSKRIRKGVIRRLQKRVHEKAKRQLEQNKDLWTILSKYSSNQEASGGVSYSDYLCLYEYVRNNKPKEVLELGTGVSTVVMSYAMMENEREGGVQGRITSMEEDKAYYDTAVRLMPSHLKRYTELLHSPKVEGYYYFFRGVRYKQIPERPYDFVFIDGPTTPSPVDGQKTFDFDFINVVSKSDSPVYGIIDARHSTGYVLGLVLGKRKVRYDFTGNRGFVGPCSRKDMRTTNDIVAEAFNLY